MSYCNRMYYTHAADVRSKQIVGASRTLFAIVSAGREKASRRVIFERRLHDAGKSCAGPIPGRRRARIYRSVTTPTLRIFVTRFLIARLAEIVANTPFRLYIDAVAVN